MKHLRLNGFLFCVSLVSILASCGGANEKTSTTDSTAAADSAAKTTAAQAVNTIVTTPQNMMIITHKVANYATWLKAYEGHDSARLASGIHNYVIGRGLKDSNMVMVALKMDDTARARAFARDAGLRKAMQKGGVVGAPAISIITATWQDTATIETKLRSRSSFLVKDWDAWLKAFEEARQERTDNGLTVRVIGHDLGNDKKVSLVTAITDTAKAFAFYKSDALKKRRQASGVIGEPARFVFQIVKRY